MNKRVSSIILTVLLSLTVLFSFGCNGSTTPPEPEKNPLKYYEYSYEKFNDLAEPLFKLPGCSQYIPPQSITYWEERDWAFVAGYVFDSKGQPDPSLYIVDIKTGEKIGSYKIYDANNIIHSSYVGGLACTTKNLFISSKGNLYRLPLNQFSTPIMDGCAQISEVIDVPAGAAHCSYADGKLWVGDFYLKGQQTNYQLPSDRPKPVGLNLQGQKYYEAQPCAFGYDLEDTESEISWNKTTEKMGATPDYCVIIQEKIRGFTLYNNFAIFVSCYGAGNAIVYYKKCDLVNQEPNATTLINGVEVPTWDRGLYYNKNSQKGLVDSVNAMPNALSVAAYKGDLLLLFSSGTQIYSMPEAQWKEAYATEYAWQLKFPSTLVEPKE